MPYQSQWVEPDRFLEHRGVRVFHTYKDDDVDQGTKPFRFTVNSECGACDARCEDLECRHVFDARQLSTWSAPAQPPHCVGKNDTPENHAAWDRYWEAEQQAIRCAIIAALESGELTANGHRPAVHPVAQPTAASQ